MTWRDDRKVIIPDHLINTHHLLAFDAVAHGRTKPTTESPAHAELARVKADYAERFTAHFDEHVAEYFFNAAIAKRKE